MRIAIHNYSQEVAVSMVDMVGEGEKKKRIAIDATDLLILDWFTNFFPSMKKKIINGKEFGWVKRSKVLEDLPILRINEKSVGERFKKLVHFGLLEYEVVFDKGKSAYFRHGETFPQLLYDFSTTEDSQKTVNRPFKGRSNSLSKGDQTPYKDRELNKQLNNKFDFKKFSCPECGHQVTKNTQTGKVSCLNCFKEF